VTKTRAILESFQPLQSAREPSTSGALNFPISRGRHRAISCEITYIAFREWRSQVTPILPPSGRVVAYIVGLENYGKVGGIKPVEYARQDAEAFAEVLKTVFPGKAIDLESRIDEDATLSTLKYELPRTIAGLQEDDVFLFYYAGHGFYGEGGNRLTAFDSNSRNLDGTTWLLRELLTDPLEGSSCRRALVFIDACAEKLEAFGRSVITPLDTEEFAAFADARFHAVFMSCEPGQKSYPSPELEHGIWTYFLLKALRGDADEALGPGRFLTGTGLQDYLGRVVSAFVADGGPDRVQRPYARIGSSGSFAILEAPEGRDQHEITARRRRTHAKDLIAIGPAVVAVGEVVGADGSLWTIEIDDFVIGDWLALSNFVDSFEKSASRHRYVLVNAMGEGRTIARAPAWKKSDGKIHFVCNVEPPAGRISADRLPSTIALSPVDGDIFAERGSIARISGLASFPQLLQTTMSLVRGEAVLDLDEGAVFSDYYAAFRDSPWLRRLFKLEVIRLSSIARQPVTAKSETTPLLCVDRVRDLELLDPSPKNRRLRIRLELDVSEVGAWSGEIPVLVLNEEALRECRARVAASHRLFQPTVVIPGIVEAKPVTLPAGALRSIRGTKR
jgi:hypothetical protein